MRNKGFIAVSIIYSLFFVFLLLMVLIMANYTNNRVKFDIYRDDIKIEYSSIDMVAPECKLDITSQNTDGVSGRIYAIDSKSGVADEASFNFTNIKSTTKYVFSDNNGNETECTLVINEITTHSTRSKTYNSCISTHRECVGGYYDPHNCARAYSCPEKYACGTKCKTCYYNSFLETSCYGCGSETVYCTRNVTCYAYDGACGNTAYDSCISTKNVCDGGYDYGEWSNYINGDCSGKDNDVCKTSSTYEGQLVTN